MVLLLVYLSCLRRTRVGQGVYVDGCGVGDVFFTEAMTEIVFIIFYLIQI